MKPAKQTLQPWINSASSDLAFILLPPFLALSIVALFPKQFKESDEMPVLSWLFLIVFIDVAHVYSTLYRTYFNKKEYNEKKSLLLCVPLFCYITGVIFYNIDGIIFWRLLAYLAVFHFVRQQYGFMRLYSRSEKQNPWSSFIDSLTIYTSTLYPILYWHLTPNRNFSWFTDNDFLHFNSTYLSIAAFYLYLTILALYVVKEVIYIYHSSQINIPKIILIIGTALSWYFGIVFFNGDMAFTVLNVISHGIPYMALIWFFERKKHVGSADKSNAITKLSFGNYGIVIFIVILATLAYAEEGLWDGLIWKEHSSLFPSFAPLPKVEEKKLLSFIVPLLALPQFTHYVLDGFIWKRKNNAEMREV